MCTIFFYFVFFKKKIFDPEPDPELSEKSDPDPEIIFSAPTHCFLFLDVWRSLLKFIRFLLGLHRLLDLALIHKPNREGGSDCY